jgi:hypothetical protein
MWLPQIEMAESAEVQIRFFAFYNQWYESYFVSYEDEDLFCGLDTRTI